MTFHVNPKTGNPSVCRAKTGNCPFGEITEHYESKEDARLSYEKKQESFAKWNNESIYPPSPKSYTLSVFKPDTENSRNNYELREKFYHDLEKASDGTRLVTETGWIFEKSELWSHASGQSAWTVKERPFRDSLRAEKGRTYNVGILGSSFVKGARLEEGGERPTLRKTSEV